MAKVPVLAILPPVIFAGIAGLFFSGMYFGNDDKLPSTFIGKEAPALPTEALEGTVQLTPEMLRSGEVTLVNFWASWCPPCRAEHPVLHELAEQGYRVAGVNFRDTQGAASDYLRTTLRRHCPRYSPEHRPPQPSFPPDHDANRPLFPHAR
ncbi:MAG: hypothetical protein EBR05_10090 [Marivivens sp.]|nr:hypothetical protein [Marivivens sp.]